MGFFLQLATTSPDLPSDVSRFLQEGPSLLLQWPRRGGRHRVFLHHLKSCQSSHGEGARGSSHITPEHCLWCPKYPGAGPQRDLSEPLPHLAKYRVCEGWREILALGFAHGAELGPCCSSFLEAELRNHPEDSEPVRARQPSCCFIAPSLFL